MPTIRISEDDYYPFYSVVEEGGTKIRISKEKLKWIQDTMGQLQEVQNYLEKRLKNFIIVNRDITVHMGHGIIKTVTIKG